MPSGTVIRQTVATDLNTNTSYEKVGSACKNITVAFSHILPTTVSVLISVSHQHRKINYYLAKVI